MSLLKVSVERENGLLKEWKTGRWESYGKFAKILGKSDEWVVLEVEVHD